jgi:hypothetical protein
MAHDLIVAAVGGKVLGIDAMTGQVRWENGMEGGGYGEVGLAIANDRIVVSAARGKVFCLAYPSGAELWTAKTSSMGRATILIEGELVLVAKSGKLDCFDLATGEERWSQPLPRTGYGSVAIGAPGNVVQADEIGKTE